MSPQRVYILLGVLLLSVLLLITGHMDFDWMVVAPRFNEWYFSVDVWEFAPWLIMNWHVAYVYTVVRVALGWFILGGVMSEFRHIGDSS